MKTTWLIVIVILVFAVAGYLIYLNNKKYSTEGKPCTVGMSTSRSVGEIVTPPATVVQPTTSTNGTIVNGICVANK